MVIIDVEMRTKCARMVRDGDEGSGDSQG